MENEAFHKLAAAIARALGGKVTRRNDPGDCKYAEFITAQGLPLNVAPAAYNAPDKIRVSVVMPRKGDTAGRYLARDLYSRGEVQPDTEICVSVAKSPERIAADITRRLIPGASEAHARAVAEARTAEDYKQGTAETLLLLAARLGVLLDERDKRDNSMRCGPAHLYVQGPNAVKIDTLYLTAERAARVIDLLRESDPDYREGAQ